MWGGRKGRPRKGGFERVRTPVHEPGRGLFSGSDVRSSAQADTVDRLPLRTKFFFGIGSVGDSIILATVGSYALPYYNQILGLTADLVVLAVPATRVFDGFAASVLGSLSD